MEIIIISNNNKSKATLLLAFILSLTLFGCNTIEGAGTDIKQGGQALERAAEESKEATASCCPYCARPITCRKY